MQNFGGRHEQTLNPKIVEGLIHVPDEHNGLVRLFRTTRDRCSTGEIPGLKIRLYNKGGIHGYELLILSRLDWVKKDQKDLLSDYLLGMYDVVSQGDREGIEAGSMIMLPRTFTSRPRYMYSLYKSLGNPQYFITFTCNMKWQEIKWYIASSHSLTPSDRADIVCRVFEQKVNDFIKFLKYKKPFGYVIA
nr:DNA helicase [Tanacetum cinerariifolium]